MFCISCKKTVLSFSPFFADVSMNPTLRSSACSYDENERERRKREERKKGEEERGEEGGSRGREEKKEKKRRRKWRKEGENVLV